MGGHWGYYVAPAGCGRCHGPPAAWLWEAFGREFDTWRFVVVICLLFFPFLFFVVFSCYIDAIMIISYIEILIVISVYSPDATSNGAKIGT